MNTAQRSPAPTEWAALTAVVLGVLLAGGCGGHSPQRDAAPSQDSMPHERLEPEVAHRSEETKAPQTAVRGDSLGSMCNRVCASVGEQAKNREACLVRHGLIPPTRWGLEVRVDPAAETCPRKLLLARRVRDALTQGLSTLDGISLADSQSDSHGEHMRLDIGIRTDFGAGAVDKVQCEFILTLGENRHVHRDSFESDDGLVCIKAPGGSDTLLVNAVRDGGDPVDLETAPEKWFLMRRGRYEKITVRSRMKVWAAPLVVGVQNLWDMSRPPIDETTNSRASGQSPVPSQPPAANAEGERPGLAILSPADGAEVGRAVTVSGVVTGRDVARLEGSRVEVAVISDMEYWQDGQGTVRNRTWHVPYCYVGRAGREDDGKTFQVRARLQLADGFIQSETICVVRR